MKKLFSLLLALCLTVMPFAFAEEDIHIDEDGAVIENPIHEAATLEELQAAVPGVALPTLPAEANSIRYSYVHVDSPIAQIEFCWEEDFFTLRAAALPADGVARDIDGLYLVFDEVDELSNLYEGDEDSLRIMSSTEEEYAVCDWTRADLNTQYSLFSETAGEPEMPIIDLAALLIAFDTDWTTADE